MKYKIRRVMKPHIPDMKAVNEWEEMMGEPVLDPNPIKEIAFLGIGVFSIMENGEKRAHPCTRRDPRRERRFERIAATF